MKVRWENFSPGIIYEKFSARIELYGDNFAGEGIWRGKNFRWRDFPWREEISLDRSWIFGHYLKTTRN